MSDTHAEEFNELLGGYQYPITAWATQDLVRLANIIDIELQQRADEVDVDAIYS
jgi:hypothetical protein